MATVQLPSLPAPHAELASYISKHPNESMTELVEPYRKFEAELRRLYAQDPANEVLKDPYVNVLPLFTEVTPDLKVRARNPKAEPKTEKDKYIMPLPDDLRRPSGSPATVQSAKEFQHNFNVFSESSLVDLNWDNVVAAGSSVVNCLLPVPKEYSASKRSLREYYHEKFCPASDVDLFLYGLTDEQAIEKIKQIETSIRDAILTETTTVRTKHAITICSQYPTRHVQIVLRIYKSISEILTGFDIDCSGAAYDGKQVYCTPRALQSYMTQINHIDLTRRSPSYENRLSKYSHRNFEVYWSELDRSKIDPTIFERSFQRTVGLARLLVLERLPTTSARESYANKRRAERGRPPKNNNGNMYGRHARRSIKDIHEDEVAEWVTEDEISNYHTFTIPYGPKIHAKKIEKLCYTRDLLLNAEWNQPKDRKVYLHRHPAFFGRVEDVVHDCCGSCPKPETEEELEISAEESKVYISGEISFMKDDPGRQEIGSFNPLTDNDWTEMAYVGNTARLCQAIVDGDLQEVKDWLAQEDADPNRRDYTGRTPLHLAVMSSTPEIVKCLVDHGARLVARIADGRTALHLAAERGDVDIIRILMDKSAENEAKEEEKADQRRKAKEASKAEGENSDKMDVDAEGSDAGSDGELIDAEESEDGSHTMATGSFVKVRKGEKDAGEDQGEAVPEDDDEPDFFDPNVLAWDTPCSALHLAIVSGHHEAVKLLCQDYGADVLLPVKFFGYNNQPTAALLTLVLALALPVEKAKIMVKTLLSLGATSAQADIYGVTAFQRYVEENAPALVETLWELDRTGSAVSLNHLAFPSSLMTTTSPLLAAVANGDARLVLKLLDAGAVAQIDFETWLKSAKQAPNMESHLSTFEQNTKTFDKMTEQPLIVALKAYNGSIALELLNRGANPNSLPTATYNLIHGNYFWNDYDDGMTALDLVRHQLKGLRGYEGEEIRVSKPVDVLQGAGEFLAKFKPGTWQHWVVSKDIEKGESLHLVATEHYEREKARVASLRGVAEKKEAIAELITQLERAEAVIVEKGGKPFEELYKDLSTLPRNAPLPIHQQPKPGNYVFRFGFRGVTDVTQARLEAYIALFEAAWEGDLPTIKRLCLSAWDDEKKESPLKITVTDDKLNNPFSLAFQRGHYDVARAILDIARAQYSPEVEPNARFRMETAEDDEEFSEGYDSESGSDDGRPKIYREIVDDQFTIEDIGAVSMQVKSHEKPIQLLEKTCPGFVYRDGKIEEMPGIACLFTHAVTKNDRKELKLLLDMATYYGGKKMGLDDEPSKFYSFSTRAFEYAVVKGRIELLTEIIPRTGAGLPLEELVKRTGIELQSEAKYYQGLTVYGKKRKDWAQAGRGQVRPSQQTGSKSPLLRAALAGCIESVEWFLSDAPMRLYLDFARSKAAQEDARLKHLSQAPGGFDRAIARWLNNQSDLVIHSAVLSWTGKKTLALVDYLAKVCPSSLAAKSSQGYTPLHLACLVGRPDVAKLLIDHGSDQATRDAQGENLLHAALKHNPSAAQLRTFLDLLDPAARARMFHSRGGASGAQHTPLHAWLCGCVTPAAAYGWPGSAGKRYESTDELIAALRVLIEYSARDNNQPIPRELAMLDGAGDTPLHSLIGKDADAALLRALLDFDPQLLYRENAVGRTPAEVAHDRFVASRIAASHADAAGNVYSDRVLLETRSPLKRGPETFVSASSADSKGEEEGGHDAKRPRVGEPGQSQSEAKEDEKNVWTPIQTYMARFPGRRRLVGLHEANDVARRLGDVFQAQRYGVRPAAPWLSRRRQLQLQQQQQRRRPDDEEENQEEEKEDKKEDEEEEETPGVFRSVSDFVEESLPVRIRMAWKWDEDQEKDKDEEEVFQVPRFQHLLEGN